jgi:hypothetical protein
VPRVIQEPAPRRPAYFWWLLANALALSFAVLSWSVCLHVFGNPEVPRNYGILRKIGRLPEIERYSALDAPDGNLLDPRGLYSRFYPLGGERLEQLNARMMRNYLTNFQQPLALTYIEGDFEVLKARELVAGDFIGDGFVVRARAMVKPDDFTKPAPFPLLIDHIFPTLESDAVREFRPGDILSIRKSPNCAAIIRIGRANDEDGDSLLCLTVAPIAYGPYRVGDHATFGIEPPRHVNPGASFPLIESKPPQNPTE